MKKKQQKLYKATMKHIIILAEKVGTTKEAMLNAVMIGHFHDELCEVIG